jgi:hypothetical protein
MADVTKEGGSLPIPQELQRVQRVIVVYHRAVAVHGSKHVGKLVRQDSADLQRLETLRGLLLQRSRPITGRGRGSVKISSYRLDDAVQALVW